MRGDFLRWRSGVADNSHAVIGAAWRAKQGQQGRRKGVISLVRLALFCVVVRGFGVVNLGV